MVRLNDLITGYVYQTVQVNALKGQFISARGSTPRKGYAMFDGRPVRAA